MRARWVGLWAFVLFVCGLSEAWAEPKTPKTPKAPKTPKVTAPSKATAPFKDKIACSRDPRVPPRFDIWVVLGSGQVFFDDPLFYKNLPGAVVYVYRPNDPTCRKASSEATSKARTTAGAATAPKIAPKIAPSIKVAPSAIDTEAARKQKEAREREARERQTKDAQTKKQTESAKQEQARGEQQARAAEEERHRQRERAQRNVLPREGVTAKWTKKVLPQSRDEGVTKAWPTNVLPTATSARCGLSPAAGAALPNARDAAAILRAREPLLNHLVAFERAKSEADKDAARRALRQLFADIPAGAAPRFQANLSGKKDDLALKFRALLQGDPIYKELLGVLEKKYMPTQCAPPAPEPAPQAPAPQASASPGSVTLPAVMLALEGAFETVHKEARQRIDVLGDGVEKLVRGATLAYKEDFKTRVLKKLRGRLLLALQATQTAFGERHTQTKLEGLRRAGDAYTSVLLMTSLVQAQLNMVLVMDWADAKGQATGTLDAASIAYGNDPLIAAIMHAAMDGDRAAMEAALPAAIPRYEYYIKRLDQWIASVEDGAVLSHRVIKAMDILMLAASIYNVWKIPVLPEGGAPGPVTILGLLPGGAALGSVNLPSLADALESIRKLVAIGALDGSIIAGLGQLGGGPGVALPELQRPTNLSIQGPRMPGGGAPKLTTPSGKPNPAAKPTGPRTVKPNDATNARAYELENESADAFAKAGYKVEQNPPTPPGSDKNPDYRIEGEYVDCYAPKRDTSVRNVWKNIWDKVVKKNQAFRIALNLDDWHGDFSALQKQFKDWSIPGLIEIFIVQDGKVTRLLP